MTPVDDSIAADEIHLFNPIPPHTKLDFRSQHLAHGEENMHLHNALLQTMRDQHMGELTRFQAD